MKLRDAIREAEELGIQVRKIDRTGEIQFLFDGPWETVNDRRKDAPRPLMMRLRQERQKRPVRGKPVNRP